MSISHPATLRHFLLAATLLSSPLLWTAPFPAAAQVSIGISVELPPPPLPDYEQPIMPDAGYVWTPGYWSWSQPIGYYWVPGTWVQPPEAGVLWTPPYWAWLNGLYYLHQGYWGPHVGYYGGVDYGYGYDGNGYDGGRWEGRTFHYNRFANNLGAFAGRDVYEQPIVRGTRNYVSFADGPGGNRAVPNDDNRRAERERHAPMTEEQTAHISAAVRLPDMAASHNQGRPPIVATPRAAQFQAPVPPQGGPARDGGRAYAPASGAVPPAAEVQRPAAHVAPPVEAPRPMPNGAPPPAAHVAPPVEAPRPMPNVAPPPAAHEAPAAHPAQGERQKER